MYPEKIANADVPELSENYDRLYHHCDSTD